MSFVPYHPEECQGLWAQLFEPGGVPYYVQLLRFDPQSHVPPHEHTEDQWFIVLEGEIQDEGGSYTQGTMKFFPQGSRHEVFSQEGALVLYVKRKVE